MNRANFIQNYENTEIRQILSILACFCIIQICFEMNNDAFLQALKFVKYKLFARHKNGHGIHSPFVYSLLRNAIEGKEKPTYFKDFKALFRKLKNTNSEIEVSDFGAGSRKSKGKKRKISTIARSAVSSAKYSLLLFRLMNYLKPENVIEIGTSLGVNTLYMASAQSVKKLITLEGCPHISAIAQQHFKELNFENIELECENFDISFKKALEKIQIADFIFFDGNHKMEPTLRYFNQALAYIHNDTCFVFDDIHWSEEMEEAWEKIKQNETVVLTIDLFFVGLVFFRKEMKKQHFTIRF